MALGGITRFAKCFIARHWADGNSEVLRWKTYGRSGRLSPSQGQEFLPPRYTLTGTGNIFFPPLDDGQYRIWLRRWVFELSRAEQAVSSGKKIQQDFTLKVFPGFQKQLSDAEWIDSLADGTPDDKTNEEGHP